MSTRLIRSSKPVTTSRDSLQSVTFPAISTGFIEKLSSVTLSPPHVSKQQKSTSDLIFVQTKRMQTLTTLGKKLEIEQKKKSRQM